MNRTEADNLIAELAAVVERHVDAPPPPPPAPTAAISVTPARIEDSHDGSHFAQVSWSATNAFETFLNGETVAAQGSRFVSPTVGTHIYTLAVVSGTGEVANATATLEVVPHSHEPDPPPDIHPDDPAKQAEHLAMLALVTPQSASLYVPKGETVTLEGSTSHHTIRVDGTLVIRGSLRTDTIVCDAGSRLEVRAGARITFTDTGTIDDPFILGRGIIAHGTVEFSGAWKTPYVEIQDAKAGDKTITLTALPALAANWNVGDDLVLTGDAYGQHETARIQAITGNLITLAEALRFNHGTLADSRKTVTQPTVCGNLTRSITLESEATEPSRRAHVMFMHSRAVKVAGVQFKNIGRQDKSRVVTDPDGQGNGRDNPRGRYACHFHRSGTRLSDAPAECINSVVWGSPGLGFVNHESHVLIEDCVSYDVFGSHFFTETGNELGSFRRNLAVHSVGVPETGAQTVEDRGNFDFGHLGHGFWFQGSGGGCIVEDNLAMGHHSGFITQGVSSGSFPTENLRPDSPAIGHETPAYIGGIQAHDVPMLWRRNSSWAARSAPIIIWATHQAASYHRGRSLIEDCKSFGPVMLGYSGHLHFKRFAVIGDVNNPLPLSAINHTDISFANIYEDCTVEGFRYGLQCPTQNCFTYTDLGSEVLGGYWNNLNDFVIENLQPWLTRTLHFDGKQKFGEIDPKVLAVQKFNWWDEPGVQQSHYSMTLNNFHFQAGTARTYPSVMTGLFDSPSPANGNDKVTIGKQYLTFMECGPEWSFGSNHWYGMPEFIMSRTVKQLEDDLGLYVAGLRTPRGAKWLPKSVAWISDEPAVPVEPMRVLTPREVSDAAYTLIVDDHAGGAVTTVQATLEPGWNCVPVVFNGRNRGVLVLRD